MCIFIKIICSFIVLVERSTKILKAGWMWLKSENGSSSLLAYQRASEKEAEETLMHSWVFYYFCGYLHKPFMPNDKNRSVIKA